MKAYIWCDGAAMKTPNPGPAGAGYVIVGDVQHLGSDPLGNAGNNAAEWSALLNALRVAADKGATWALVRMDSSLVLDQLAGRAEVKAKHLIPLRDAVKEQLRRFPGGVTFKQIPGKWNGVADALAKAAALASKAAAAVTDA